MSETPTGKTPLLGVDWIKTVAGALAAVSTTVLLSTLGAAGTLIGAALGSIAATIATAVYSQTLDRSRARVRQLSELATGYAPNRRRPYGEAPVGGRTSEPAAADGAPPEGWLDGLRQLPWRRLLPAALVMFLAVVAVVTIFELVSGRTLASTVRGGDGGGTTISHVTDSGGGGTRHPRPTPTGGPRPTAPSETPTGSPSPSASSTPSAEPSGSPSVPPSDAGSPSVESSPTTSTPEPSFGETPSVSPAAEAPPTQ